MKKFISLLLSLLLIFGMASTAFAADENAENTGYEYPLVIVRGINFDGLYLNYGTENEANCLASPGASEIMKLIGRLGLTFMTRKSLDVDAVIEFADGMMGSMACDSDGNSVYDVSVAEYPLAVSNYPDFIAECEGYPYNELGVVRNAVDYYGAENTYYFSYDWRLDPSDTADDLNTMIERAKADHDTDKVDIICCSMGGIITDSYIYEYGTDSIHSVIFNSSTFCGTYVTTDLFRGKVLVTENMLYNMARDNISSKFLLTVLYKLGIFKAAANLAMKIVDNHKEYIYDNLLRDIFVTMPSLWALVQHENYEECIEYMFPTDEMKAQYAGLIERADKLQEMVAVMDDLLLSLPEKGVKVAVIAAYNNQMVPVYESAVFQSDGTLESPLMLGRAVVSETGSTLGDDYVAANPEKLSPDRCVDLSGVLFPEYTWALKNAGHVIGNYGSELSEFLFWLLAYDGQPTVTTDSRYPQFIKSDANETLNYFD